ncbi:inositol polyphosphate kinase family protein [Endozoicomonas sp. Mp262]|uniref:inositol polyphosphate kinase family protein n=1 Tax=Endozoicomonas sp. Mp262 TaxID=2919499 RepID=UPI0021D9F0BD
MGDRDVRIFHDSDSEPEVDSDRDSVYFSDSDSIYSSSSDSTSVYSSGTDSDYSSDSDLDSTYSSDNESSNPLDKGGSIGAAGHADTFVRVGDKYIGKLTVASEADVYENRTRLNLDSVIPKTKSLEQLNQHELDALSPLMSRAKENESMRVIVPEMLGCDIPEEQKLEMDIKIGYRTASTEQLRLDGHKSPLKKTAKHMVMDTAYGSKARGYRVEGVKIRGKKPKAKRLALTRHSKGYVKKLIGMAGPENTNKILVDLKAIRNNQLFSDVSFVASSVLILVDEKNPENTVVKLIDLAHPIYSDGKDFSAVRDENKAAMNKLIGYFETQKKKRGW